MTRRRTLSKKPSTKWIGKILEITKDDTFGIISGSSAYSLNLLKGQRLKVISTQEGNWLQCKLLNKTFFQMQHGIQMSEFEQRWSEQFWGKSYTTGEGLVIGISLNFDIGKFKVVKK